MAVKIKNLSFKYAKEKVLQKINLHVEKGDFIGIIGPNGSGKTTLMKNICKLLEPTEGAIVIENKPLHEYSTKALAKCLSALSESPKTEFKFTVHDIVLMGRYPHLKLFEEPSRKDMGIVRKAMEETQIWALRNSFIGEISAGERQRAFIAQVLAQEPRIILLDEPTAHLDLSHETELFNLISTLNKKEKITVITILHDLNLASHYCNKLVLLSKGKIYAAGSVERVLTKQNIEKVYGVRVRIEKDPLTGKPFVRQIRNT